MEERKKIEFKEVELEFISKELQENNEKSQQQSRKKKEERSEQKARPEHFKFEKGKKKKQIHIDKSIC